MTTNYDNLDYINLSKQYGIEIPTWYLQDRSRAGFIDNLSYQSYLENKNQAISDWQTKVLQKYKIDEQKNQLKNEYQNAYNEAKAANEARYKQILTDYDTLISDTAAKYKSRYDDAMASLEGMGTAAKAEINTQYDKTAGKAAQSLINSGLHSTTVAPAVQGQVEKARQQAIALLNENLRREKLGYQTELSEQEIAALTALAEGKLGVMERREDEYPSENMYLTLLQNLGNTNG
jgi:hypothetical protein